jgi:hypothetical protein
VSARTLPDLVDAVLSHALATGAVERHARHEPTGAPGQGVTVAVVLRRFGPPQGRSTLASSACRVELAVQLYAPTSGQPAQADRVDPALWLAADALMRAYSGDFTLAGDAAYIDLLGAHGTALSGELGYARMGDGFYRVLTITLPIIIDDLWTQVA